MRDQTNWCLLAFISQNLIRNLETTQIFFMPLRTSPTIEPDEKIGQAGRAHCVLG